MEFRLTYEGPLYSETNRNGEVRRARADHKHELRKKFHPQLKRLWELNPVLAPPKGPTASLLYAPNGPGYVPEPPHTIDSLAYRFSRFGYRFVPLATRTMSLLCSIEVLYLRAEQPGSILRHGDIDNRLKVVFDALQVPREANQVGRYAAPDADEDPFFCLLEDDSIISRAAVETDTLLAPEVGADETNAARLVISVKLRPYSPTVNNMMFA